MINTLFLIRNEKEYQIAERIIEKRRLNGSVMLSWSEKEPYIADTCSNLKGVMKWAEFQINDMNLSGYWFTNYRDIESTVFKGMEKLSQDRIARSAHFNFGLVCKLGNYYHHIEVLNKFFKDYRPETIIFTPKKSLISSIMLFFTRLYGTKHEILDI